MKEQVFTNLSDKEVVALSTLVKLGSASVLKWSKASGLKRTTIYNFIDRLIDLGLVEEEIINGSKKYRTTRKLPNWITPRKKIENKYKNFEILTTDYAMRRAIMNSLGAQNKRIDWLVGAPETTDYLGKRFIEKYFEEIVRRNINLRTLRSPLTKPAHKYGSEEAVKRFKRVMRVSQSTLPFKTTFTIHDDTVTFISSDHGGVGYKITDKDMAESFRFIYNGLWKYSKVIGEEY